MKLTLIALIFVLLFITQILNEREITSSSESLTHSTSVSGSMGGGSNSKTDKNDSGSGRGEVFIQDTSKQWKSKPQTGE